MILEFTPVDMPYIYKNVNIPSLLVLPVYCNMLEPGGLLTTTNKRVPLIMWMYKCGLENCFLDEQGENLMLVFNDLVIQDHETISSNHYSLASRLVSYSQHMDNVHKDGSVHFRFRIPRSMRNDIELIMDSKYSKVSDFYLQHSDTINNNVVVWEDNLGYFLMSNNMPRNIFTRHEDLKKLISESLGIILPPDVDFVRKFDKELDVY